MPAALAEAQGEQLGANTQNAIAEAQGRLAKNEALRNIGKATSVFAAAPDASAEGQASLGQALALAAQAGVTPETFTKGVHGNQENNSYNTIVNPETPDAVVARHLVAEGREGGIIRPTAAGEASTNILHPEQGVQTTPLGQALIPAKVAQQAAATDNLKAETLLHKAQAAAGGFRPPTPPGGDPNKPYQFALNDDGSPKLDDNGQRVVIPVSGGAKDPDAPHAMGANQTNQFLRTINASRQAVADLGNVMDLPVGASTGYFGGVGASKGHSIGSTMAANLANKLNGTDQRNYNTIMAGLNQNLSALETFGLAPRGALVGSMDRLAIQPTDDEGNALVKLAQARQIVEQALQTHISNNPTLSDKQRATLQPILDSIQSQVPFTVRDILKLQNNPDSPQTLTDLVKARGFGAAAPTPTHATSAGGTPPAVNGQGWALHRDAHGNMAYVSPDGKQFQEVQ